MLTLLLLSITSATPIYTEAEGKKLGKQCFEKKKRCAELAKVAGAGCEASKAQACEQLSNVLFSELPGVKQDKEAAEVARKKACDLGAPISCIYVANGLLLDGKPEEAYALIQRTCDQGSDDACLVVPTTFQATKAGEVDYSDSVKLEKQCGDARLADQACGLLGRSQLNQGKVAAGVRNLDRACQAGNSSVCTLLGQLYSAGDAGVPQDLQKAVVYSKRALVSGPGSFLPQMRSDAGVRH